MTTFFRRIISHRFFKIFLILLLSVLCGLAWYLLLYGRYPLYFTNVNWTYFIGGDVLKAQIGWEWFRQEPWHFPIGHIDSYAYPSGTSLSFLDAIPLMAIPLKLLSPLLEQRFQYLGLWELISLVGQMFFGMLIIGEFTSSLPKKILGATMLVLSPPLIFRAFFHGSLSAHWILLAGIWFILLEYRHKLWRWSWALLITISMFVHLYIVAMLLPLWAVSLFFQYSRVKRKWGLAVDILVVAGLILLAGYSLGLFSLGVNNLSDSGFGYYSWNLNEFINPGQSTSVLNELAMNPEGGQYEGFSYLGFGNLVLLPIAILLFFEKDHSKNRKYFFLPFMIVSLLLMIFALSNKAFLNNQIIWNIELPKSIFTLVSLFRSSGRFIWPVFYFLVLFGLISMIRNYRSATPFLIFVLVLQLIDVQGLFPSKKFNNFGVYQSPLQHTEFWRPAAETNRHIVLLPVNDSPPGLNPFIIYARQNNLTLNWGYFSRADNEAIDEYANKAWEELKLNLADKQTIYVFWDPLWEDRVEENLSDSMLICKVDGYEVALSVDNLITETVTDLSEYCTQP